MINCSCFVEFILIKIQKVVYQFDIFSYYLANARLSYLELNLYVVSRPQTFVIYKKIEEHLLTGVELRCFTLFTKLFEK